MYQPCLHMDNLYRAKLEEVRSTQRPSVEKQLQKVNTFTYICFLVSQNGKFRYFFKILLERTNTLIIIVLIFATNRPSVISYLGLTCQQLSRTSHNTCSHKGFCSTGTAFRPLSVRTSSPGRRISPAYPHAHNLLKIQLKCIKLTIRTIFYDL